MVRWISHGCRIPSEGVTFLPGTTYIEPTRGRRRVIVGPGGRPSSASLPVSLLSPFSLSLTPSTALTFSHPSPCRSGPASSTSQPYRMPAMLLSRALVRASPRLAATATPMATLLAPHARFFASSFVRRSEYPPENPERSEDEVDVCIVGAGPAGLSAAIRISEAHSSLSLRRRRRP